MLSAEIQRVIERRAPLGGDLDWPLHWWQGKRESRCAVRVAIPRLILSATLGGVLGLTAACGRAESIPVGSLPPELQPLSKAEIDRSERHPAGFVVSYSLNATYPAEQVISAIEAQIGGDWKSLDHLRRNESIRSSRLRGWTGFIDTASRPIAYVHQWWSEWENGDGALLTYILEFRSPLRSSDPTQVLESPAVELLQVTGSIELGLDPPKRQHETEQAPHDRNREAQEPQAVRASSAASELFALRTLSPEPTAGAEESAILDGRTYFFDSESVVADARDVIAQSIDLVEGRAPDETSVWHVRFALMEEGARRLRAWADSHRGTQLGIFLSGRLVEAPIVNFAAHSPLLIRVGSSRSEAEALARDLRSASVAASSAPSG